MKKNDNYLLSFDRRQKILEIVNERRSISVDELSGFFPVSSITIRRDLDRLAFEGVLKRVHGGAMALSNIVIAPRASEQFAKITDYKMRIGKEASKHIADGDFIIIETGSTCQALVLNLTDKKRLKIVTASPRILMMLSEISEKYSGDFEIISCGGLLSIYKNFLLGPHARSLFEKIRVDLAFLTVTAIDIDEGITADDMYEAEITKTILEKSAKRKIGLITSDKFGKTSFVKVAPVEIFNEIITDKNLDQEIIYRYQEKGIKIIAV